MHKFSIDYYLYNSEITNIQSKSKSSSINIDLSDLFKKKIKKGNQKEKNGIKNKCPLMRRPINDKCPNNTFLRLNAHGNKCCYKK